MTLNQKVHWTLRVSSVAVAALVVNYGSAVGLTATGRSLPPAPCTLMCAMGGSCPSGFHRAWDPEFGDTPNGSSDPNGTHEECFNLTCSETHHCQVAEPLVDQVASAIDGGNIVALQRLLSGNISLVINRERGAFQVSGCGGDVVANLPASAELIDQVLGSN